MSRSGLGSVAWWGFSPPLNFLSEIKSVPASADTKDPLSTTTELAQDHEPSAVLNVLLVGASDPRHVIETVAQIRIQQHRQMDGGEDDSKKQISKVVFHVYEPCVELYARQLLLTSIALEDPTQQLLDSAEIDDHLAFLTQCYLELSFNTLLTSKCATLLREKIEELLRRMVTEIGGESGVFDFSLLKHKELDALENVFKFWKKQALTYGDMARIWDQRVRDQLGSRYDNKEGVFDWDHSMTLADRNLHEVISREDYINWRSTGIAFTASNKNQTNADLTIENCTIKDPADFEPNPTLLADAILGPPGHRFTRVGYWGDICSGPFASWVAGKPAFSELVSKRNKKMVYSCQDVMFWNVLARLYETKFGGKLCLQELGDFNFKQRSVPAQFTCDSSKTCRKGHESSFFLPNADIQIVLMPFKNLSETLRKPKFQDYFDAVFLSTGLAHVVGDVGQSGCMKQSAMVVVENTKAIVEVNNAQYEEYLKRVEDLGRSADDTEKIRNCNAPGKFFIRFKHDAPSVDSLNQRIK